MTALLRRGTLRYEIRILGFWLFMLPLFVALLFVIAAGMMAFKQAHQSDISNMLMVGIEGAIPLAVGIACATIVAHEPALELQLTMPLAYWLTVFRRFLLLVGWSMLIEVVGVLLLLWIAPWALKKDGIGYLLTWFAPLLWCAGWGTVLAVLLRNRAASIAILGVAWVFELAFHSLMAGYGWTQALYIFATMFSAASSFWLQNRLELLATAVVLFIVTWFYLRNTEWRLRGEDA